MVSCGTPRAADHRFTIWTFEFLRYDLTLGLWAGAGARLSLFEDHQAHRREWPVSFAPRLPMGVTLRLAPLPVELGFNVNPQVFDIYRLGLPRIRPEAGLELLVEFPSGY